MPLPANGIDWPPTELANITPAMQQWSAWYEGTPEALRAAYARSGGSNPLDARVTMARDAQHRGLRGMLQRFWWGRTIIDGTQAQRDTIHIPIAADICQASADLLFADPPTLKAPKTNKAMQARLEELADDSLYSTFAEAAETSAALGGTYLRVVWDKTIEPDAPFLTAVDADGAWPEFQWGRLRAVTFWKIVATQGQVVWRHLERHELNQAGVGIVLHGLYEGSVDTLGRAQPLNLQPATAIFIDALGPGGFISTESPGLAVTYIPNQRPQRRWRKDPAGCDLGRSDLDGIEPLMDALDEVYASWMRDIRLGKARILAARSMLENLGAGNGAIFDAEQEIYSPVNALISPKDSGGLPIEQIQFKIRFEEHQATAQEIVNNILRTAGYSTQTFGEGTEAGGLRTATEVESKERRSLLTRDRKIRHWKPGIANILQKLMAVDVALFAGKYTPERPDVNFTDGVQETQLSLAQTALALRQAEAASTEILVGIVHPDWEDEDIAAEAARILEEAKTAAAASAPTLFGAPEDAPPVEPGNPDEPPKPDGPQQ